MPDDGQKDQPTGEAAVQDQPVAAFQPVQEVSASAASPGRAELLNRARTFLTSPQVRLQDSDAKRTFLGEKGLTPNEVDQLLRELPPAVPPRTYPPPPPSNLPNLLIGAARVFTWLTGTSAIVLFLYYRYLLPRLAQSYQARIALRKHQSALIIRLTESVSDLKAAQAGSYKDLPRTVPVYEDSQYAHCHAIDDLLSHVGGSREGSSQPEADIPDITILRCALEELGRSKTDGTSTEELFRHIESKLPWLGREEGASRQSDLWNQLNTCSLFTSLPEPDAPGPLSPDHPSRLLWKYIPPPVPLTPPMFTALANLHAVLLRGQGPGGSPPTTTISSRQRTLQVLSDFTGYITTQTYSLGLSLTRGAAATSGGDPVEDELRREIRALKGLVLNRRTFLPFGAGAASGFASEPPRSS